MSQKDSFIYAPIFRTQPSLKSKSKLKRRPQDCPGGGQGEITTPKPTLTLFNEHCTACHLIPSSTFLDILPFPSLSNGGDFTVTSIVCVAFCTKTFLCGGIFLSIFEQDTFLYEIFYWGQKSRYIVVFLSNTRILKCGSEFHV